MDHKLLTTVLFTLSASHPSLYQATQLVTIFPAVLQPTSENPPRLPGKPVLCNLYHPLPGTAKEKTLASFISDSHVRVKRHLPESPGYALHASAVNTDRPAQQGQQEAQTLKKNSVRNRQAIHQAESGPLNPLSLKQEINSTNTLQLQAFRFPGKRKKRTGCFYHALSHS